MRDLHNNITYRRAISPAVAVTNNTAIVSEIIDRQSYGSLEFVIQTGSLADADATFTVLVEDGDAANLSDNGAVADEFLIGTEAAASFTFAADDAVKKIGYKGIKRYVRLTVTPAGNTGDVYVSAVAALGKPNVVPVA